MRNKLISLGSVLILTLCVSPARAGTLTDLNSLLADLNIKATELGVPCDLATAKTTVDDSDVKQNRTSLVTALSSSLLIETLSKLQNLSDSVQKQEADEIVAAEACLPYKLNEIEIRANKDKLERISQLPNNPTEEMISAAAEGKFIYLRKCDASYASIAGAYIQVLQPDSTRLDKQAKFGLWSHPGCPGGFGRWVIVDLAPGSVFHSFLPVFPDSTEPDVTVPDFTSQFEAQRQQALADSQNAKSGYLKVWEAALWTDIQNVIKVAQSTLVNLDAQIKLQSSKFPNNQGSYLKLIASEPNFPTLVSDNSDNLLQASSFVNQVASFQKNLSAALGDLLPKKVTIDCYKGSKVKKVIGLSPKCPTGFKPRK